jgi:GNAT superfamily N-acetyltransferase
VGCQITQFSLIYKMIRPCTATDLTVIHNIINEAAAAYHGIIPDDCWHEPYMSLAALQTEIDSGVHFWGWEDAGILVGVMGIQPVKDVTLIRHAYVLQSFQGRGIGGLLLDNLTGKTRGVLLVGTWASAHWAIRLYEKHGFRLVPAAEKDRLLSTYWNISFRQKETSVVLEKRHEDNYSAGIE